ncbi:hypothetical protein PTSG_06361 [Salpingoeca rosetta]|uniref:Methyltransferase domain-containing protein n=1 Tax=Salpingoeca rosetta (strain ATCC 50818 / BSB-021) TaxID=946362 RepID=F2UCP4_SALR5|nr:uncharacterized protein PTSG_06361 [Salpingoeca rosetta]EGD74351.1 hypothetical protein PTSG_06361 [Salpingoeca rosetta]|eukprot:XP_004993251.1 hypothetical protein PTSG_06361 [Salpingoeca rosetta]
MDAVVVDDTWSGSEVDGIIKAESKLRDTPFVFVATNHAHDPELISKMATSGHVLDGTGAACLIEHDVEGMVGLPQTTIFGAWPALDDSHVTAVGTNLKAYNGVFAGLAAFPGDVFKKARTLHETDPAADLSALLNVYARKDTLHLIKNDAKSVWLAGLTEASRDFSVQQLEKMGSPLKLQTGEEVVVLGDHSASTDEEGGDWSLFSVEKWRNAVFTTKSFFEQLYADTHTFIEQQVEKLGGRDNVCLIEVGCGTGETIIPLASAAKYCIGIDINEDFIKYSQVQNKADNVRFVCGDATKLQELLSTSEVADWAGEPLRKLVICVGNTIGIIPEFLRDSIYRNMAEVAGDDGACVVIYWNGNCFGEAVQHFYNENPQLCGPFKGKHVDFQACTLQTPSGYNTKWTKPEEARELLQSKGLTTLEVVEQGRGVMAVFRK